MEERLNLAEMILNFINNYAKKNMNDEFISVSSYKLEKLMNSLKNETIELYELCFIDDFYDNDGFLKGGEELFNEIIQKYKSLMSSKCPKCRKIITQPYMSCPFCFSKISD